MSVGYRCQDLGFAFHWEPWSSTPYFVSAEGRRIDLAVANHVPFLEAKGAVANVRTVVAATQPWPMAETDAEDEVQNVSGPMPANL